MNDSFYDKYSPYWGLLCCLLIPIKLSLTYICLVPLLLLFIFSSNLKSYFALPRARSVYIPFAVFIFVSFLTAIFGIDPLNSLRKLSEMVFFSMAIFLFYDLSKKVRVEQMILCLCTGHLLSGSYAVVRASFNHSIDEVFIGPVTQSGQLACSVILAMGLLLFSKRQIHVATNESVLQNEYIKTTFIGLVVFFLFVATAFGNSTGIVFYTLLTLLSFVTLKALHLCSLALRSSKVNYPDYYHLLAVYVLPILFANILANLKRGPWLGILCGMCLLLFILASRKLYVVIPCILASFSLLIPPVYSRLMHSQADFFISGGRYLLWQIGIEISSRFPLGIGYDNSQIVKSFSPSIPDELEHFHNNALNLLVETGYVGLCLFVWWLYSIWRLTLTKGRATSSILPVSIGCAIVAWQVAGIVEYNFGDSEITLLIFLLLGLLLGTLSEQEPAT